jgi:hypothetical protein
MVLRRAGWLIAGLLALIPALPAFQREFRQYISMEGYDNLPLPPDWNFRNDGRGRSWRQGGTSWSEDYPKGDRIFARLLRRLTRVDVRSVEQPVNLEDGDDVYNWPFLYMGLPGHWELTDDMARKLRDFLLRGGFLYCDDFWGVEEWAGFERGMRKIFPDRDIIELDNDSPIFHTIYDLHERYQVANWRSLHYRGVPYRAEGTVPHWRAVLDDQQRIMVAIVFNSDIGDSWEWADDPSYPEKYSSLGIRLSINYLMYDLTH